jgi:hypothetical protein
MELPNDFDVNFYRNYYQDLHHMNDDELRNHYLNHGHLENRIYKNIYDIYSYINTQKSIYSDLHFLSENELIKYCIKYDKVNNILPTDFDIDFYRNYYHDLQHISDIELINHYLNHGRSENRIYKNNDMKSRYISLGSWCGNTWSLRQNCLNDCDRSLPFDFIRSKFEGIIDCFENNFQNFFPKNLEVDIIDNYKYNNISIRGKYFGFFHHDLRHNEVIDGFHRRIQRLHDYLNSNNEKIIFVRTILNKNIDEEINLGKRFIEVINSKYPSLKYLLIFIISEQSQTIYYKNISNNIFIFTVNDIDHRWNLIKDRYKYIYDFIKERDLFNNIPESNNIIINYNIKGLEDEYIVLPFRDDN